MMQGAAFKALTELCHSCFGFFGGGGHNIQVCE